MMTKLIRSMTIEDEQGDSITIDALDVTDFDVSNCMLTIEHQYQEHLHFPSKSNSEIFRMFNATLCEALNAPVQVTQAVLDAMNKVPEAQFWHVEGSVNTRLKWDDALETFTVNGQTLTITDYIQSDCPLALEALLQFYTDGTSVVVQ